MSRPSSSRGKTRPQIQALAQLERACHEWNRQNPVGTTVEYYPIIGDRHFRVHQTSSEAYVMSGHTAVVHLIGVAGCVAIEACKPVPAPGAPEFAL